MLVDFSRRQTVEVDGRLSRSNELQEDFIASLVFESGKIFVKLPQCESEIHGTLTANDSIREVARARAGVVTLDVAVIVLIDGAESANGVRPSGSLSFEDVHSSIMKQLS